VSLAPVPSAEEIIRLYEAGELGAELALYHEHPDGEDNPFLQRCVDLHNTGQIDLISIPSQPAFANVTGHSFFTAQHIYCEAISQLRADVIELMECCRILIKQAGSDLAATQPNAAFRKWCENNLRSSAVVIEKARTGDELARQFVTFALQASGDVQGAFEFVNAFQDDRRLSAMAALSGMSCTRFC
jgi:hypothetical protein